jgi:ferredoxin
MTDVEIDETRCCGYGNCLVAAPEVFDLHPDTGIAFLLEGRPLPADRDALREAAADCPARAISVRG